MKVSLRVSTRGLFLNRRITLFLSRRESLCTDFSFGWCLVYLQGLELRVKSLLEVVIDHRNHLSYISYQMNKVFSDMNVTIFSFRKL